jgi:hypothetical protein
VFVAAIPVGVVSLFVALRLPERPLREEARFSGTGAASVTV